MEILKLTDICKDYMQGKEPVRVLKNINLTVHKGDYLAIMGPSGSGKTTLMNLIGCLDVPTSGTYELEGQNLQDLTDDQLADIRPVAHETQSIVSGNPSAAGFGGCPESIPVFLFGDMLLVIDQTVHIIL